MYCLCISYLFSVEFFDAVECFVHALFRRAERDADISFAVRAEDEAGCQEHFGLVEQTVGESFGCDCGVIYFTPQEQSALGWVECASEFIHDFFGDFPA